MSDRYLVLIHRGGLPDRIPATWYSELSDADLKSTTVAAGMTAFTQQGLRCVVMPDRGLIIGTLFARCDDRRMGLADLAALAPDKDLHRWLIDQAWGRYVAISAGPRGAVDILRDPAGMVACCVASTPEWIAVASEARLLQRLGFMKGEIDWRSVAGHLLMQDFRSRSTCLAMVTEPVPGERMRIAGREPTFDPLWLPGNFVGGHDKLAFKQHADALRDTIDRCAAAWTRGHEKVVLSLSGGLDSSILATSLPEARSRLFAVNFSSGEGRGAEQEYAVALADRYGFSLAHVRLDGRNVDVSRSLAAAQPRPSARSFTQPFDRALRERATTAGATAHLNGGGGDSVFGFLHSANPAADRLLDAGPGSAFVRTVLDLSDLTQCTPWHVGRRALAKAWFDRPRFAWPKAQALLSPTAIDLASGLSHPWMEGLSLLRPGQREHGLAILRAMSTLDYLNIDDERPTYYPLLSQPLVEQCLSIPTWLNCRGGRDRAVARAAYVDRFPPTVASRRMKGSFDTLVVRAVEYHRSRLREMLMDGRLASQGLIDRAQVLEALDRPFGAATSHGRLLQLGDIEAWLTEWT